MRPTDIASLITLSSPTLTPGGDAAVVAANRPDLEADEYRSRLWRVRLDGSEPPRSLTSGPSDTAPRISPDGRWIAFLRKGEPQKGDPAKGKPQLALLPTDGGDARVLTSLPGGAGAPVWSPDSRSIAFVARVPEPGRYGTDEKVPPEKEPPRRITTMRYRRDNVGFLIDRRAHVFVVDLPDDEAEPAPRQLTDGDYDDEGGLAWSPDGHWLVFTSTRHENRERELTTDLFVVRPDGSEPRQVTHSSLSLSSPRYTPDGRALLALGVDSGPERNRWVASQQGLFRIDLDTGAAARLTDPETANLVSADIAVDEAGRALVLVENRGAVDLQAIGLDTGEASVVSEGHRMVTGVAAAGGSIAVSYADDTSPGELGAVREGVVDPLTDFGAQLRGTGGIRPMTELLATAPDGQPVHGWVVTPEGDGPHPVLLMIHGGPFAQYGWTVFDEAQVYAGAGYAVVYGNPRGSSGYGAAYGQWILGDVGERSSTDLFTLLDAALTRDDLDASRVGVLGGSHGGFMTTWLLGHSDRFFAGVSERAVNAIDSFEGSSDIGWNFADDLWRPEKGDPARPDLAESPLTYAEHIAAPLLIIHSEQDWRCPLEQAQRLFVALRKRGATAELLLFPGEGHEMSRSGTPRHRVARFEAIIDWFDRFQPKP